MKKTKRIISIITALTLALSLFAIMPTASAVEAEQNYTVTHRYEGEKVPVMIENDDYAALTNNLLDANQLPTVYFPATDESSERTLVDVTTMNDGLNQFKMLTDRQIANINNTDCWAQLRKTGSGTARNVEQIDLEYDLGAVCNVERFVFASVQDVSSGTTNISYHGKYYVGQYEVYLSNTKEDLYNSENLIYSFDQPDDYAQIRSGLQDVVFAKAEQGRYLAIKIIEPISYRTDDEAAATGVWPHIAEIGVFGSEYYIDTLRDNNTYSDASLRYTDATYEATFGDSLIAGKQATVGIYDTDESGNLRVLDPYVNNGTENISKLSLLTDNTIVGTSKHNYAQLYYKNGENPITVVSKMDIEYDLGDYCSVDRFFLAGVNHDLRVDEYTYWSKFSIGEFEVYLADSKADLYNKDNLIYSYRYSDTYRATQFDVQYSKPIEGKYLAVRILNPTSNGNNGYPRISAIAVMGEKIETAEPGDVNNDGSVDICDLVHLSIILKDNNLAVANADVDGSGEVDSDDLSALRTILLNN